MSRFTLDCNIAEAAPVASADLRPSLKKLANVLDSAASGHGGLGSHSIVARNTGVVGSGTLTLATCLVGTVVEVNGAEFVAIASGTPDTAQGQFVISGTDTADATSLAAAINASTNAAISGVLTASSSGAVVTVSSALPGLQANAISIKTLGVRANGTVTAASVAADDTVTLNGTSLTAKVQRATGTLTAASAAAADTFSIRGYTFTGQTGASTVGSLHFSVDTGNDACATDIAAQINGFAGLSGIVTATAASAVVTIRAVDAGTAGNAIALTGTATRLAASAATLEGGIAVANNEFDCSSGSTNTQVAADLVRAINASTTAAINTFVKATNAAAVVTVRAQHSGTIGNAITLASSNGTRLAVSAARLAGGTVASVEGAQASATVTCAAAAAADTVTINGVVVTAHATVEANDQFAVSGDDTADAVSLAKAINTSTTAGLADVIATNSAAVVTITARRGGISGNAITLASSNGTRLAVSAARLASGAAATTVVPSAARLASGSNGSAITLSF